MYTAISSLVHVRLLTGPTLSCANLRAMLKCNVTTRFFLLLLYMPGMCVWAASVVNNNANINVCKYLTVYDHITLGAYHVHTVYCSACDNY